MSTQSSGSRALAPAPPPVDRPTGSGGSSPSAASNTPAAGIKRASTACQSCKQIKRKCDQAQPCSNCRKSHTLCVYNEADDGRRKAARKRTVESLELKRDALDSILESLRTSDDHHVQSLVHLIRSQAPLDDIVQYATTHADNLPSNQVRNITTVVNGRPRKTVLSVNDLCDTPLVRVPSAPWTDVTRDDEFVSHLISIYFTWFHIAYPIMDRELFLRDMESGSLTSQYCNPLLVNSMLTIACHFSDHPRACKIPSDTNTRGRHFLEEATRLWNEQEGRPSLLNIQAASILAVSSTLVGKDRLSLSYIEQMNRMLQEYMFKTIQAEARGALVVSSQVKRMQILTSRVAFLLTVGYGSAFMRPSATAPPAVVSSTSQVLESSITWSPYPQRTPEVTVNFDELHKAYLTLHEIGLEILQTHFGDESKAHSEKLEHLDEVLRDWKRDLPGHLQLIRDSTVIKPPIMDLQITLFNFAKGPSQTGATPIHNANPVKDQARSTIIESARAIAELCRQYTHDFGLKQPTIWMPQSAVSAAHSLLDDLSGSIQESLVQDTFHELCIVLVAASQRWLVMKGHVRMLFMTAEEKGLILPPKTKNLLKFVALDRWGGTDHLQFASASYPNYALAKDEDPRLTAMGDLLEKWANTRIGEEGEEAVVERAHALNAELRAMTEPSGQANPLPQMYSESTDS